jgi:hypothetical protein
MQGREMIGISNIVEDIQLYETMWLRTEFLKKFRFLIFTTFWK